MQYIKVERDAINLAIQGSTGMSITEYTLDCVSPYDIVVEFRHKNVSLSTILHIAERLTYDTLHPAGQIIVTLDGCILLQFLKSELREEFLDTLGEIQTLQILNNPGEELAGG